MTDAEREWHHLGYGDQIDKLKKMPVGLIW